MLLGFGGFCFGDFNLGDLGWAEGFADIFGSIVAPVDDINFLAVADFVHDSGDTDATATNESTDWVDTRYGGGDGNLGATAGLAGDTFNLDGTGVEFGNFLTEETLDKFGATSREDKLGTTIAVVDFLDENFDAVTNGIVFAIDLLTAGHDATTATEVDTNDFGFDTRDGTDYDGTNLVLEGGKNGIIFGFTETLDDDLLGCHGGNTAEALDGIFLFDDITKFSVWVKLDGFSERNLGSWVISDIVLDDSTSNVDVGGAIGGIEAGANVHLTVAVVFAPGGGDGLFDDFEDSISWQTLFFCYDVNHSGHLFEV